MSLIIFCFLEVPCQALHSLVLGHKPEDYVNTAELPDAEVPKMPNSGET